MPLDDSDEDTSRKLVPMFEDEEEIRSKTYRFNFEFKAAHTVAIRRFDGLVKLEVARNRKRQYAGGFVGYSTRRRGARSEDGGDIRPSCSELRTKIVHSAPTKWWYNSLRFHLDTHVASVSPNASRPLLFLTESAVRRYESVNRTQGQLKESHTLVLTIRPHAPRARHQA